MLTKEPDDLIKYFKRMVSTCNKINLFLKQNIHMQVAADISFGWLVILSIGQIGQVLYNSVLSDATGHHCNIKKYIAAENNPPFWRNLAAIFYCCTKKMIFVMC